MICNRGKRAKNGSIQQRGRDNLGLIEKIEKNKQRQTRDTLTYINLTEKHTHNMEINNRDKAPGLMLILLSVVECVGELCV